MRRPGTSFLLFVVLLAVLWIGGGASRADALGQALSRAAASFAIALTFLLASRSLRVGDVRAPACLLAAAIALVLLQLVPLPPSLWQALPGRGLFAEAAAVPDGVWRPLAIVPDAAVNAALSLIVPAATLLLLMWMPAEDKALLPASMLVLILASMLLGLLQLSGANFNNPLINDGAGQVSGSFGNRNHFALFLAIGCLIVPVWAFSGGRRAGWRGIAAVGMLLIFVLMILASGSRAGLLLGLIAIVLGLLIVRRGIRAELRRAPRWAFPAMLAGIAVLIASFALVSISAGRAEAVRRALSASAGEDMRVRGLSTVVESVLDTFPAGSGFGSFDPVFRIREPVELLQVVYFNHAHNDFLEVTLDGGLPGVLLLVAALSWWLLASLRAWRAKDHPGQTLAKLGSAILLLILFASAVDYPARTPMMMAVIVIAAVWLGGVKRGSRSALPA